jgi:hypothetical protein
MTQPLPDKDKGTCLLTAVQTETRVAIHLHNLGKKSNLLTKSLTLKVSPQDISKMLASEALKYIGGRQIIHFGDVTAVTLLESLVTSAGFKPIDNDLYDIAPLAKAFCRVQGLPASPTLDDFAQLRGFTRKDRDHAQHSVKTRATIVQDIWTSIVLSPLGYSRDLEAHVVPTPRSISEIDLSLHGLPLPAPITPDLPEPHGGWRRTKWGAEEAQDCAFRFVEGASLEDLSSLFRRSPRAICARLTLDGILLKP